VAITLAFLAKRWFTATDALLLNENRKLRKRRIKWNGNKEKEMAFDDIPEDKELSFRCTCGGNIKERDGKWECDSCDWKWDDCGQVSDFINAPIMISAWSSGDANYSIRSGVDMLRCTTSDSSRMAVPSNNTEENTLKQIADIAHYGGLAGLTEVEALIAVRRLTLMYLDKGRNTDAMTLDTLAALRASKAAGN
jgi:hypothetical protein